MNNHQLIKSLSDFPQHSIHRIPPGAAFNRWLTMTAQPPNIAGLTFATIRKMLLDVLYEDWANYRDMAIEQTT